MIDAIITPIVTSIPLLLLILVALIFVKYAFPRSSLPDPVYGPHRSTDQHDGNRPGYS